MKLQDSGSKATYKVTGASAGKYTVEYVKPASKTVKTATVPNSIKAGGITYKVTSIAPNAFKNNKKLTKVTIGKYITAIGTKAFYGCKKLKSITIKTTKLTSAKVGSKAFKGTHKKAVLKVPKSKLKSYKKFLGKKGVAKTAKIKK